MGIYIDIEPLPPCMVAACWDPVVEGYQPTTPGRSRPVAGIARIDFLPKREEIVIEIKKTRSMLKEKEICKELTIDKERYRTHPNCKTLLAFVYGSDKHINNPIGFEIDLSESRGSLLVKIVVTQG
jgi:REase_DpnII-MboI